MYDCVETPSVLVNFRLPKMARGIADGSTVDKPMSELASRSREAVELCPRSTAGAPRPHLIDAAALRPQVLPEG